MKNLFTDVEEALVAAGKFITGVASSFEKLYAKEKALAPALATAISKTVGDLESLIALATPAAGAEGLNFPADSAAYAQFLVVKDDLVSLASQLTAALKAV